LLSTFRQFADRGQRRSGFEQRLEARHDFWPADGNRAYELGAGPVDFVDDRQLHDLACRLDLDRTTGVALFVQFGFELVAPSEDQPPWLVDLKISPVSATRPPGKTSFQGDPAFQSVSMFMPNQYFSMNSGVVSAAHNFSGVVRM
jgi:hypothetical protein